MVEPSFWVVWFAVAVALLGDNATPVPAPTLVMANRAKSAPPIAFFLFLLLLTSNENINFKTITFFKKMG